MAVAGNTLETCPENLTAASGSEPCIKANNNDKNMVYVNVDPGNGRFDSSTATLTLPAEARVVKAYLYWAADLSRGVNRPPNDASDDAPAGASPETNSLYRTVLLRAGTAPAGYATINAAAAGRDGRWDYVESWYSQTGKTPGWAYQVRADVTPEINAALATRARRTRSGGSSLPVTVANVQAGKGYNRYAGWNLVVVWETKTAPYRDVTLFDGFAFVQVQAGEQLVVGPLDFTGFQTPDSGNIDARATVWTTEGDREITGDYMSLGDQATSCSALKKQSDALHPVDNFFNSTISDEGKAVGGRDPSYDNQLGFDLATLAIPNGTISNGSTGASVCLGTVGDTYFFGGLAFSVLIKAPNLNIVKTADHTTANPGDVVTYTTTVTNPSTRPPGDPLTGTPVNAATNLVVADPLPSGLDFVGFTVNPGNACTYVSATRTVQCSLARLDPDATFSYAYQARVDAAAQGPAAATLTNSACYLANSEDQPTVDYRGCDDASIQVPPSPFVDLGVTKTVSAEEVAPGATLTWTVVGTNYGPGASTGFTIADELPPGVAFVSASGQAPLSCTTPPAGASGAVTCTAPGSVAAGTSLTVTIVAAVPAGTATGTVLLNVATVTGDQPEPTPDPHPNRAVTQTLVVVPSEPPPTPHPAPPPEPEGPLQPPPLLQVAGEIARGPAGTLLALGKTSSPGLVPLGGTVSYRLRVANVGEASALRVRVCDTLPGGLTVTSSPGLTRSGGQLCTTIGSLRVGGSRTFHITAIVSSGAGRRAVNRATAHALNAPSRKAKAVTVIPPGRGLG